MTSQIVPSSEGNPARSQLPMLRCFGEPRFHADGELLALACAADGSLWSVEEPGILRRWNIATGRRIEQHFLSDLETFWSFTPDARLLASASDDLSLWDVPTGKLVGTITQPSWVTTVAFSPDLSQVATGHDDGIVRIWNIAGRKLVREIEGHEQPVSALAFSPDGRRLASTGEDRVAYIWNLASGERQLTLSGHTDRIPCLAWHPQGHRLVTAGWDTTARVWDTSNGEPVILLNSHADQVNLVAFRHDGQVLACADSENQIHLWHSTTWQTLHILKDHEEEIRCLCFSPDGRRLISGGAEQIVHIWDVDRGRLLSEGSSPSRHSISVAGGTQGWRLASNCGGTGLRVWDPLTDRVVVSEELAGVLAITCSPDGKWLASGGSDTRIRLWQAGSGEPFLTLIGQRGPVAALRFSPQGDLLASASSSDGTVWLWNLKTGDPALLVLEAADGCTVETVAWHPEGRLLACGGIDWLATGGSDGAVCIWDIQTPSKLCIFEHGTTAIDFHPSGRWLAAASLDEVIFIWDVETQQLAAELGGHKDGITCLGFSPDGRWLVSGSEDRTLRIWDAESREPLAVREMDTALHALSFSSDGRYLFTANANTTCFMLETSRLLDD